MPISENIKRLREAHGMTQAQFGAIAGVTDKAVSTWESGKKEPRMGAVQKLCDYFGISKTDILLDSEDLARITPTVDSDLNHYLETLRNRSEMRMLFDASENATREQIEAIVRFLEGMQQK